ncbi:Endonuclease/exonuclease/phosphatase, partial [Lentinula detonsa]
MRRNRIILMGIQETKLRENEHLELMEQNKVLTIYNNPDPNGKAAGGEAFLINNDLARNKNISHEILIKGKASRLLIQLGPNDRLNIINAYTPNNEKEKTEFFKQLTRKIRKLKENDDIILMADFNAVTESTDRLPQRRDDPKVEEALEKLIKQIKGVDGWREANTERLDYTFTSKSNGSMARIDRIYVNKETKKNYSNWDIDTTLNLSDHKIITVFRNKENTPYIGKSQWKMTKDLVEYKPFKQRTGEILVELQEKLIEDRTCYKNPQQLWLKAKETIARIAMEMDKKRKAEINTKRKALRE